MGALFDGMDPVMLFGFAGTGTALVWPICRSRVTILMVQVISNILFAAHYGLLGATTAMTLSALSAAQAAAAIPLGTRPGFRYVYLGTLPVIAGLLMTTWSGAPSALSSAGMTFVSVGRYQTDLLRFRLILALAGPFWFAHNLIVLSYAGMTADIICGAINLYMLSRLFRERRPAAA